MVQRGGRTMSPGMMVVVSLGVNVAVLVPVIWGLVAGTQDAAFGPDTSARRVLICV